MLESVHNLCKVHDLSFLFLFLNLKWVSHLKQTSAVLLVLSASEKWEKNPLLGIRIEFKSQF